MSSQKCVLRGLSPSAAKRAADLARLTKTGSCIPAGGPSPYARAYVAERKRAREAGEPTRDRGE